MKVLLIYPWIHHNRMMAKLANVLSENGIEADVLCLNNYEFTATRKSVIVSLVLFVEKIIKCFRPVRFRPKLRTWFERYVMPIMFKKYDKVDFHAYWDHYLNMMSGCIANHIQYDICLWGSEVLRADKADFNRREFGYSHSGKIKAIDLLLRKISSEYDGKFDSKFATVYFGNSNYPVIDELNEEDCHRIAQEMEIEVPGKINVVCGYNGMVNQQHSLMLGEIEKLSTEQKGMIHVVIPMTYEKKNSYRDEVESLLKTMNVSYKIIDFYLSPQQLAVLRRMSSITLNTQTTDAFCGAIQESLYCRNIVMIADWLEYPPYDRENVFYIKSKVEDFNTHLADILANYQEYKNKAAENHKKLLELTSWNGVSLAWVNAYK